MTGACRVAVMFLGLLTSGELGRADEPPVNAKCPVMTDEDVNPDLTVTYEGRKIAFCCEKCVTRFQANPVRYLANITEGPRDPGAQGPMGEDASPLTPNPSPFWARLHPAIVHFPIAGLPLALVGFFAWTLTAKESFAKADFVPLLLGAVTSVPAFLTGNMAEEAEQFSASMHEIAERHELFSTATMVVALVLVVLRVWRWNRLNGSWRWAYGGGLVAASALVGITGYLGGSLVFGPDHLKW